MATAIESDCSISTDKQKCEELKKKAEDIQDIIEIKEKTEQTLESQLKVLNTQQDKNEAELDKTKDKVDELSGKISSLEKDINNQEKQIAYQKAILSGLMQSYYADYQQGLLSIVLASQNFSDILGQSDYIEHSSLKVSDVLASIKESKARLDKQKADLDGKKLESERLKKELEDKNLNLQYTEDKKTALLGQTQAEKEKYQKLLDDIENEIYSLEANLSLSVDWSKLPLGKSGYMHWPVNPHVITQGYGKTSFARTSGIYKNNFHNGIDLSVSYKGVFSVRGGKIVGTGLSLIHI